MELSPSSFKAEITKLKIELSNSHTRASSLQEKLIKKKQKIKRLKEENYSSFLQQEQLKHVVEQTSIEARTVRESLNATIEKMKQAITNLNSENKTLREENDTILIAALVERESLQKTTRDYEGKFENLRLVIDACRAKLARTRKNPG